MVGEEARAAVLTPGSSGNASEADIAGGLAANGASEAPRVGECPIGTDSAAVAIGVQLLAACALVAGDRVFDEVEGSRVAVVTGLGGAGVFSNDDAPSGSLE